MLPNLIRWRLGACSEAPASHCTSASSPLYRFAENIGFAAVVVTELELCEVQRQILLADIMVSAHDSALQERPERFNRIGMRGSDNVFTLSVADDLVFIAVKES